MHAPNSLSNAPRSKWGKCNCSSNTHKPKFDGVAEECEVGRGVGRRGKGVLATHDIVHSFRLAASLDTSQRCLRCVAFLFSFISFSFLFFLLYFVLVLIQFNNRCVFFQHFFALCFFAASAALCILHCCCQRSEPEVAQQRQRQQWRQRPLVQMKLHLLPQTLKEI